VCLSLCIDDRASDVLAGMGITGSLLGMITGVVCVVGAVIGVSGPLQLVVGFFFFFCFLLLLLLLFLVITRE
jgi:hypothetical protein